MEQYLRFIELRKDINTKFNLKGTELDLLLAVAKMQYANQPITVMRLILNKEIACHATLRPIFKRMVSKKLLRIKNSQVDERKKEVFLGQAGSQYFERLSKAVLRATSQ